MDICKLPTYVVRLQQAKTLARLDRSYHTILLELGCAEFTYTYYNKDFSATKIIKHDYTSNYLRQWHRHFCRNNYESVDPIGQKVRTRIVPIIWNLSEEYNKARAAEKRLFSDAMDYGLKTGISIPIHSPNGDSAILVIHGKNIFQQMREKPGLEFTLHQLTLHYHQQVTSLLHKDNKQLKFKLTNREQQCLALTAKQLDAQQIADALNISVRTVGFHLENVNKKLHTKNKYHSVSKAFSLGLVVPN